MEDDDSKLYDRVIELIGNPAHPDLFKLAQAIVWNGTIFEQIRACGMLSALWLAAVAHGEDVAASK